MNIATRFKIARVLNTQKRINTLDFSLEQILEKLGHVGLSRIRSRSLQLGKVLTESSKNKATTSGALSSRFLWGLGLTAFLLRSLFGNGQGMLVMEHKGTLVGIPVVMKLCGVCCGPSA